MFCIQITSSFQLFYLLYLVGQYFFRYLFFILFIVFLSYFLHVLTYNLCNLILIFCIQIASSFQLLLLDLIVWPIFFKGVILYDGFFCFKIFWNIFLKIYSFSALFLLIFVVKLSFSKSLQSISVVRKCPSSARIWFFFSFFGGTNTKFILFSVDLLYLDNHQFLAILFVLFVCPIFFQVPFLFFLLFFCLIF